MDSEQKTYRNKRMCAVVIDSFRRAVSNEDKISNTEIQRLLENYLKIIKKIMHEIEQRKLKWYSCVSRMEERLLKILITGELQERIEDNFSLYEDTMWKSQWRNSG